MQISNPQKNEFSERKKKALLENLRSEFSNPLDVIIGYGEILFEELSNLPIEESSEINEKRKVDLKRILDEATTLQNEVDVAFEIANLTSKKSDLNLSEFIRKLNHTLLTPLNSIIGYVELLWEEGFSKYGMQMNQDLQHIYNAGRLFIGYINKIGEIAKTQIEEGPLIENFKALSKTVDEVVSSIPSLEQQISVQPLREGTVLVVDDNLMELDLLIRRVKFYGYSAVPCDSGSKVLEILQNEHIDLVLLQIIMAGVNGFEVLKQIRQHDLYRYLPVIVISPLKELDAIVRCLEFGADDYLPKPFHSVIFKARINGCIEKKKLIDLQQHYLQNLEIEKEKSERLLLNTLPAAIVNRLKNGEAFIADRIESATISFMDIVDFSPLSEKLSPQELISLLNKVFSMVDALIDKYQVEKIKTIGDSYMAVAGLTIPNPNHAELICELSLDVLNEVQKVNEELGYQLELRIGVHSGPVVAGIIGTKKFSYDLWGRSVNLAGRMESQGAPGKIQVSEITYQMLKEKFDFSPRGEINVRGIGKINTYFLIGRKTA